MYTLHKTSRTALPAVLRHPPCPSVGILCNPTEHMLVVLRQYMMWLASMRGQPFPFLVDVSNNDVGWHPCGVSHFPFLVDVAHNDVAAAYIASPSGSARMAQGTISNVRTLLKQLCEHCSQEVLPVLTPASGGVGQTPALTHLRGCLTLNLRRFLS